MTVPYTANPRHDDRTYAVQGPLAVPSGATDYLPPFFMRLNPGETCVLVGVMAMIRGGTSVTLTIQQNGSNISSDLNNIVITTSPQTFPLTVFQDVVNGDYFAPVISAVTSAPDNLTLTFLFDIYKAQ